MSYLLDALRKSEAQRRLGELPTLSSGTSYAHPAPGGGSRKWLLSVMFALAVALAGFVMWRELVLPPPLAGEGRGGGEPEMAAAPDGQDTREPPWEGAPAPTEQAPTPVGARGPSHSENPEEVRRRPAEPEPPVAEPPAPDPAPTETDEEVAAVEQAPVEADPEPTEEFTPDRREYLHQWELPASVRNELPELNVMAHIYSDDPDNRFVLMNGRRYVEGDSVGEGVTLAEIRREGAVVDFREYRFLVE